MSGSMEVAAARALARVDEAVALLGAAVPGGWSGAAADAYEARRACLMSQARAARAGVAGVLPVARAADAEAKVWRSVAGVVA